MPTPDEVNSYLDLQKCLEMRERYIFRESVATWEKEVIYDHRYPLQIYPVGKTDHFFQMKDGVVQVYANEDSKEKMTHVADATTFFTDLHEILGFIAAGNMRSLCIDRLGLLEQVGAVVVGLEQYTVLIITSFHSAL